MSTPKRIEGPNNFCDGCNDYVHPEGAPVVEVVPCVKAALDELTRPS